MIPAVSSPVLLSGDASDAGGTKAPLKSDRETFAPNSLWLRGAVAWRDSPAFPSGAGALPALTLEVGGAKGVPGGVPVREGTELGSFERETGADACLPGGFSGRGCCVPLRTKLGLCAGY